MWYPRSALALGFMLAGSAFAQEPPAQPTITQTPVPPPVAADIPVGAKSGAPLTKEDVGAWLDGFVPYALGRGDVAGAVVVVVKDGQILFEKGYGYADVASKKPVDPARTLFRPGSTSKLWTWTAVMQQVEAGKLDLDHDVNDYLDFKIPPFEGKPLTLRNILTHTSGFEESVRGLILGDPAPLPPLGEYVKRWVPQRIFAPGTTPAYSNYATALAGYIVERVSGQSFDDYLDAHLFAPLGMKNSTFRQPLPAEMKPFMSSGYLQGSGPAQPFEIVMGAPAGALSTTGEDMAKFMIANLAGGRGLLKPETATTMFGTTLGIMPAVNRMALGYFESNHNGHEIIGHGGDTVNFHSFMWLFIHDNVGLFISMNSAGAAGASGAIRGALIEQFADRYFPSPDKKPAPIDSAVSAQHAKMMAGTYITSRRSDSTFRRANEFFGQSAVRTDAKGRLITSTRTLGGAPVHWDEIAPFVWKSASSDERLGAKVVDGEVVMWGVDTSSPFTVNLPVPWYRISAWLRPVTEIGVAALALTALFWPIAAAVRRRYNAPQELTGVELKTGRALSALSALVVLTLLGWALTLPGLGIAGLGWQIWLLEIATFLTVPLLFGIAVWNLYLVWTRPRSMLARGWSVVLVLSAVFVVWTAAVFNLFHLGTTF
ncbi:MAG: serine hydrolase [Rhodospirillales bacterium]|nr:serine hydrolase [Rhodospirillales bacterium]